MRTKPFELKECIVCGEEYKHYTNNSYNKCKDCRQKDYQEKQKALFIKKNKYPLDNDAKRRRYNRIKRELNECQDRSGFASIWDKEINYMVEIGIWEWCIDLRATKPAIEPGIGKTGRKPKEFYDIPDTRHMPE